MLTKNQIKEIKQLQIKKNRILHGLFVVEGVKLVTELITSNFIYRAIYVTSQLSSQFRDAEVVANSQMLQMSGLKSPPGVLAVVEFPTSDEFDLSKGWSIVLNDLNDPGNLGTILRTADWFGISQIICSEDCVDVFNPKVVQASMGAIYRVSVQYLDVNSKIEQCLEKGIAVFAADMHGSNFNEVQFPNNGLLVLGSESHGISDEIRAMKIQCVTIPGVGMTESLNVSVAAGIICSRLPIE